MHVEVALLGSGGQSLSEPRGLPRAPAFETIEAKSSLIKADRHESSLTIRKRSQLLQCASNLIDSRGQNSYNIGRLRRKTKLWQSSSSILARPAHGRSS